MPVNTKAIRKRIKSVTSTKKITKTMEMVATSKLKYAQNAVMASTPYSVLLRSMMSEVATRVEDTTAFPLLQQSPDPRKTLLFVVTSNRGLCGGFNSNLIRLGRKAYQAEVAAGRAVTLYVAGKKGIAALRWLGVPMEKKYTDIPDKPTYADAEKFAEDLTGPFLRGEVDRVLVVYPEFKSLGSQPPTVLTLCPLGGASPAPTGGPTGDGAPGAGAARPGGAEFLFEPSPRAILERLLPLYVRLTVYRVLVSSVASEQIARRTAMKLATDNADEMVTLLTRNYNKARQGQITQELAEIIGGAAALSK